MMEGEDEAWFRLEGGSRAGELEREKRKDALVDWEKEEKSRN